MKETANSSVVDLLDHYREVSLIGGVASILHWDMETMMPSGSSGYRAEQLSYLSRLAHEKFTDPGFVQKVFESDPGRQEDLKAQKQLKKLQRELRRSTCLDAKFVGELTRMQVETQELWKKARAEKNFAIVLDSFAHLVELRREWAERLKSAPELKHEFSNLSLYEIHLDSFEPGFKASVLRTLLQELRSGILKILDRSLARSQSETLSASEKSHLAKDSGEQHKVVLEVARALGFDFSKGRLDSSTHPFCGGCPEDVRMTTRYNPGNFLEALSGVVHESGHALYEQNLPHEIRDTPCCAAASFGIHESQSRFLENQIGRSHAFCEFVSHLTQVPESVLYRALNHAEKTYIRTESDELTYNLHIMLRVEIEEALINGDLQARDVPEKWRNDFEKLFGLKVANDSEGALQDIHWYGGTFGYFPTYSIGNLLAAELFVDFQRENPNWEEEVSHGSFNRVKQFMNEKIHVRAAYDDSPTTIHAALNGRDLGTQALLNYLEKKFT